MPGRTAGAGGATVRIATVRMMTAAGVICIATSAACAAADIELGRYLASECMTCHRAQTAASSIPNLTKVPRDHFVAVIKAYRSKELPNPAMQNVASRLSDEDIESLALFFSKQP
jgi:cytochrome c